MANVIYVRTTELSGLRPEPQLGAYSAPKPPAANSATLSLCSGALLLSFAALRYSAFSRFTLTLCAVCRVLFFIQHYRNFPNKRPGRLLYHYPRQGGAYLGQRTFLLYKNAKIAQKWGRLFGRGRLFRRGRLFGKIR